MKQVYCFIFVQLFLMLIIVMIYKKNGQLYDEMRELDKKISNISNTLQSQDYWKDKIRDLEKIIDLKEVINTSLSFTPLQNKAKFIIASYTHREDELSKLSQLNHASYAAKHNFRSVFPSMIAFPENIHPFYLKEMNMLRYLEDVEDGGWLLWMDDDAFVTNFEINIHNEIKKLQEKYGNDKCLLVSKDPHPYTLLNAGVLAVSKTNYCLKLIERIFIEGPGKKRYQGDQDAFIQFLTEIGEIKPNKTEELLNEMEPGKHVIAVPNTFFNSFCRYDTYKDRPDSVWKPGHFAVHVTGMDRTDKLKYVKGILSYLETKDKSSLLC
eukprot:TRINITY_DN4040_c0_g2_i1.p1 TRINITY_DN4040_c0_g2~~TRINITY_DN4040_c0_g2_i1.p1  ORF type:complete len:324 (+),score=56.66 TRINITY_DN4040_c0_g2_i1:28-999(+)